jgi:hypothetical protein
MKNRYLVVLALLAGCAARGAHPVVPGKSHRMASLGGPSNASAINFDPQQAAITATPGALAVQNILGALKQVNDQGVVTTIGGGGGGVTSITAGTNIAVTGTASVPIVTSTAPAATDPWFASMRALAVNLDATMTDVAFSSEMGTIGASGLVSAVAGTGTVTFPPSAVDFQSGATAGATAQAQPTPNTERPIASMRGGKWLICARITKIANMATSDERMVGVGDNATTNAHLGIEGATSTTNYVTYIGGTPTNTTIAQSAAGTYDNLCLFNDTTNITAYIGTADATPTINLASQKASTTVGSAPGFWHIYVGNGGTAANTGFRVDKYEVVVAKAN